MADPQAAGGADKAARQGELQRQFEAQLAGYQRGEVVADPFSGGVVTPVIRQAIGGASLIEHQAEGGPVAGAGKTITIQREPAATHPQIGGTSAETEVERFALHLQAQIGERAAGQLHRHGLSPHYLHRAESHLAGGVVHRGHGADEQVHRQAEVAFQATLQIEHGLDAVRRQGGAACTADHAAVDPCRFRGAVEQGIHRGLQAHHIAAAADQFALQQLEQGPIGLVADAAAAAAERAGMEVAQVVGDQLAGVVVIEKGLHLAAAEAHTGIDLQTRAQGQLHLAACTRIEDIAQGGDEIKAIQTTAGPFPQGIEIEIEPEVLAENLGDIEVDVEAVAIEAEGEALAVGGEAVVVPDAQSGFDQPLQLRQQGAGLVGHRFELGQQVVEEGEGFGQGAADHRQHRCVEGLILHGAAHHCQALADATHHIAEAEVADIECSTQIGHHHSNGIPLQAARRHEARQVHRHQRALADQAGRTARERVEQGDADLCMGGDRQFTAQSRRQAQPPQAGLGLGLKVEAEAGCLDLLQIEAAVEGVPGAGLTIEADPGLQAQGDG